MRDLVILMVLLVGCGGGEREQQPAPLAAPPSPALAPPTVEEARTLIAGSPEFSDYQFTNAAYSLPMIESAMTAPGREVARKLAKAGWIALDGDGRVVLTEKARSDRRFIVRPNQVLDIVPLAKKELGEVTAVNVNPQGEPVVDFRWEWVPNEIGELLQPRYSGEQQAMATLYRDGEQWGVMRIVPKASE